MTLKIAIVGPGRSGKDETALWLGKHTRLSYWDATSRVIAPVAAARLGISEAEAWATRHDHRELWADLGDEMRRDDPAALARVTLAKGDICVGIRRRTEFRAARDAGLFGLSIWLARDVPTDPTLDYSASECDLILPNYGTIAELHGRLRRLANSWGVLKVC